MCGNSRLALHTGCVTPYPKTQTEQQNHENFDKNTSRWKGDLSSRD